MYYLYSLWESALIIVISYQFLTEHKITGIKKHRDELDPWINWKQTI